MNIEQIISAMTIDIRNNLATAVEIGRWPDGSQLTSEQLENSMQAVIAWDSTNGEVTDEPFRIQKGGILNKNAKNSESKASSTELNLDIIIKKTIQ